MLVGVEDPEDLVRATQRIEENPEISCKELESQTATCASFEGMVSASVELRVIVNTRPEYLPIGSTVECLLASLPTEERVIALQTLQIARLFHGDYCYVAFDHNDPQIAEFPLLVGDRISWISRSSVIHSRAFH
jgi:hypothetical protein